MKLTDLEPRWTGFSKELIDGLSFLCPQCRSHRIAIHFTPPIDPDSWWDRIIQPRYAMVWQRSGDSFESLSLQPSIKSDEFHFSVTSGKIVLQ